MSPYLSIRLLRLPFVVALSLRWYGLTLLQQLRYACMSRMNWSIDDVCVPCTGVMRRVDYPVSFRVPINAQASGCVTVDCSPPPLGAILQNTRLGLISLLYYFWDVGYFED